MRPQVLLIFQTRFEECTAMLKGVAHFERSHQLWTGFLDDEARAERDPQWVRSKKWDGVISRHTTPALVRTCAELKLPLGTVKSRVRLALNKLKLLVDR